MSLTAAGLLGALFIATPVGVEYATEEDAYRAAAQHFRSVKAHAAFFCEKVEFGVRHTLIIGKTASGELHYQRAEQREEKWRLSTPARFRIKGRYKYRCIDTKKQVIDAYLIR